MKKGLIFLYFVFIPSLLAWGPHDYIARAALEILPEYNKWVEIFGKENINLIPSFSWMADELHWDRGDFFVDDYVINKHLPIPINHTYPYVKKGIEVHFKRVIQAFKTENFREAFRQMGPLIHYVEDIGAPPHVTSGTGDFHGPMEQWVKNDLIKIQNYKVKILGTTEEEACKNLMESVENLKDYSKNIGEKTLLLVKETFLGTQNKREDVEALTLLAAKRSAEVLVDCLYTIFKLSEKFERIKVLDGKVNFPFVKYHEKKGAKIILIDNEKFEKLKRKLKEPYLLYESATNYTTSTDEKGNFEFYSLPEKEYRILSYRIGCQMMISKPFKIKKGKLVNITLTLPPTEPENNLVLNPDFKLFYCNKDVPEYWEKKGNFYISHPVYLTSGIEYKIGGKVKDKNTKIKMELREKWWEVEAKESFKISEIQEKIFKPKDKVTVGKIVIETQKPIKEAVEKVWIVPK